MTSHHLPFTQPNPFKIVKFVVKTVRDTLTIAGVALDIGLEALRHARESDEDREERL